MGCCVQSNGIFTKSAFFKLAVRQPPLGLQSYRKYAVFGGTNLGIHLIKRGEIFCINYCTKQLTMICLVFKTNFDFSSVDMQAFCGIFHSEF